MLLVKIVNDGTGDPELGNYNVEVSVTEKGKLKVLGEARVEGFKRQRRWLELLYDVLDRLEARYGDNRHEEK